MNSLYDARAKAKHDAAVARIQRRVVELERMLADRPGETTITVSGEAGRDVNRAIFSLSDRLGGMEQIRVLIIENDAFLPPSKRFGSRDEMVSLGVVLASAKRTLKALGVPDPE